MLTRDRQSHVHEPSLPLPALLPGLPTALSRRRAIFGAVTLAAVPAAALPALAAAPAIGEALADARLAGLADALHALEAACDAHTAAHRGDGSEAVEAEFDALTEGYGPLEEEIAATPAATMAGVMAKVRAMDVRSVRECDNDIAMSIVDDLARLHSAVGLS